MIVEAILFGLGYLLAQGQKGKGGPPLSKLPWPQEGKMPPPPAKAPPAGTPFGPPPPPPPAATPEQHAQQMERAMDQQAYDAKRMQYEQDRAAYDAERMAQAMNEGK